MEVHSCKFIPWTPSPACAITRQVVSSSKDTLPKIAVARENGDIELWCYEKTIWIRERVFPGTSANRTRSIVWVDNLILISGLHGDIVKLDLGDPTQKPKVVESLPPVWMMSLSNNKSTIAFGCEDGSIRIFRLVDDFGSTNILFWKSLEHTDRVVSLCWDIMDKFLYSGDSRCMMKKWDVASGRVQLVFGKRSQAFVWTLVVLDAQTIACGTSWGGVQLWDTKMGTVLMEFRPGRKIPNADILAMAADVEGRTLYASGCNPTLAIIRETKQRWHLETTEPTMNWRKEFGQTEGAYLPTLPVPFDVRGMVYVANNLVWISAGGVINSIPCEKLDSSVQRPKSVAVGGIVPENRIISVSKTHGLVLSHEASTLQLWRLGKAKENFVDVQHLETGAILDLAQDHSQVLQLSLKSKNVTSSSLSEDGRFIAACDAFSLKLFEISMQTTGHPIVNKVKVPAIAAVTCTFSHDSTKVFVGGIDSTTYILQITQQSKQLVATVEQQFRPDASEKLPVQHLSLNHDGTLLVSADSHNISIYDIKAAKCETLPRFEETISVLKFWNSQVEHKETGLQSLLFIVTSVNKIFTFNTETKNLAEWPLHGTLGQLHYPTRIRSMTFNPSKPQLVLVSMKHLHFITVENQLPVKYSRVLSNSPLYGEFLYDVEFIGQNQLAIFGRTLTQLLEKLPPVLAFRKFAT